MRWCFSLTWTRNKLLKADSVKEIVVDVGDLRLYLIDRLTENETKNLIRLKGQCYELCTLCMNKSICKKMTQFFQVSDDLNSELIALNPGHPRIFFAINGFVDPIITV